MKEEPLELTGVITKKLPKGSFLVDVEGNSITCTPGGKLAKNKISLLIGDWVDIEVTPYDLTRGRIVWRYKNKEEIDRKKDV